MIIIDLKMLAQITFTSALLAAVTLAKPEPLPAPPVSFPTCPNENQSMNEWSKKCNWYGPKRCRQNYAYCKMETNPVYPTTNPYGSVKMQQYILYSGGTYISPLFTYGRFFDLP